MEALRGGPAPGRAVVPRWCSSALLTHVQLGGVTHGDDERLRVVEAKWWLQLYDHPHLFLHRNWLLMKVQRFRKASRSDFPSNLEKSSLWNQVDGEAVVESRVVAGGGGVAAVKGVVPKTARPRLPSWFDWEWFKDNGCSTHYFEGIVAAFALQKPRFYVPYEFIMAFNEPLALKIQDNFSGIYEDLREAVVFYLQTKGVKSPDVVLKVLGLPAAKSVQLFLDFLETIMLHEYYSYGEFSQAVPSYDSRRMSLGYLDCLVAKFKTGRCWAGKWSEANMKVLNGSKFVIDLDEDCVLDPESGYLDLNKFCITVLNRLKVNGQFLPYFDELAEDYMLINECFGKPDKWARFLQLISNPLALKPPLVRAAFICNVYIAGDANSSGNPPTYSPLASMKNCIDWRAEAQKHSLLMKVYTNADQKTRKFKNIIDIWSPKHWHVFKFSKHFIHHVLGYTKGDDLIQKIKDISVVDLLLARTIFKAIARSFRFLVLNCGVNGIFSSAWRHYVGSNYDDKPRGEDTTTDEMLQGLLNDINNSSEQNRRGYVYCEISVYSAQNVSVLISDAELTEIQNFLNDLTLKCVRERDGAYLQCGAIKLWKRIHPATEESSEKSVVVVEGPYSAEYDTVYFALAEYLGLPPTL